MYRSERRHRPENVTVWAATGLIGLLLLSGCATTAKKEEDEARLRRAQSHFNIGVDHLEKDRVAMGLRELMISESLESENPYTQYALGQAYLLKNKPVEAEEHILHSLELLPEYHDARLTLSGMYLLRGRFPESIEHARILADDPTFPAPWQALANVAWAEIQLGNLGPARAALEDSLDFDSNYWRTHLILGILNAREGRHLDAISSFEAAIEKAPAGSAVAEANYRLAEIYVSLGKRKRAVDHLVTAVAETPDGKWGQKSEDYLRLLR
jgi:tetratricopeptide (TPR) repeat protein